MPFFQTDTKHPGWLSDLASSTAIPSNVCVHMQTLKNKAEEFSESGVLVWGKSLKKNKGGRWRLPV
jgi:hypothetical protein